MYTLLFLCGNSGSGKTYFKENTLPANLFYSLKSMTTRKPRDYEINGVHYFFVSEHDFENAKMVTYLDVNKNIRENNEPKWLYGVSETEFLAHKNSNMIYDVIEPKYVKQMIDWCHSHKLQYDIKVIHFIAEMDVYNIIDSRKCMNNDLKVRSTNTSNVQDFYNAGVHIDWTIKRYPDKTVYDQEMVDYFNTLAKHNNTGLLSLPIGAKLIKTK